MREVDGYDPHYPEGFNRVWLDLICPKFPHQVKEEIRLRQGGRCACCGALVGECLQAHHRVPENGVKRSLGVRGRNSLDNAIGLCSGQLGEGENSHDDCHENYDRLAIDRHLFAHPDGGFVPLSEMPEDLYIRVRPERTNRGKHRRRR